MRRSDWSSLGSHARSHHLTDATIHISWSGVDFAARWLHWPGVAAPKFVQPTCGPTTPSLSQPQPGQTGTPCLDEVQVCTGHPKLTDVASSGAAQSVISCRSRPACQSTNQPVRASCTNPCHAPSKLCCPVRSCALSLLVVSCCVLVWPSSASAASCGSISSPALSGISSAKVFTYKYERCRRARSIVREYMRRIRKVRRCEPMGCVRVVRGWKCRTPQVHGTMVGCVPRGQPWSGSSRPFVGIYGY